MSSKGIWLTVLMRSAHFNSLTHFDVAQQPLLLYIPCYRQCASAHFLFIYTFTNPKHPKKMTPEEQALEIAWQQSGAADFFLIVKWLIILTIAYFVVKYFVKRNRAKAQIQRDILAELKKANSVNNS
jgi:hypothetical protein